MKEIIANTKGQKLSEHCFAVGYLAYHLLESLSVENAKLKQSALIAGILHDVGKVDPAFQDWVNKKCNKTSENIIYDDGTHIDAPKKFSFESHPRHHELSWLVAENLLSGTALNDEQLKQVVHTIYWHHTQPYRKQDKFSSSEAIYSVFRASLPNNDIERIKDKIDSFLAEIAELSERFGIKRELPELKSSFQSVRSSLPDYKTYPPWLAQIENFKNKIRENALNSLVRAAVISADRLASSFSSEELTDYIQKNSLKTTLDRYLQQEDTDLHEAIRLCLQGFEKKHPESVRNKTQAGAATSLAALQKYAEDNGNGASNVGVLQGPAGCGKTKIALEWAYKTGAKKIIWVCPRVQVCLGLLYDLTEDEYLPNIRIEIFTGEYKKILQKKKPFDQATETLPGEYFSGDIVITTVDQIVNAVITHQKVTTMIDFLNAHVVFDEFHELINLTAFNLLFAELITAKREKGSRADTLLVSATPNYYFLQSFLDVQPADIIRIDSFNSSQYQIVFQTYTDDEEVSPLLTQAQKDDTFVITNTAIDAQLGYLQQQDKENAVLLHSKYTRQDKSYWFNQAYESFRKGGCRKFNVLRSGPIVQAALNISCNKMLTEPTCAENWLQRLGRLNRFAENNSISPYITVISDGFSAKADKCMKFLNHLCIGRSTKAWIKYLRSKLENENTVTIKHLYAIYQDFYNDTQSRKLIEQDFIESLKKSAELISKKLVDPVSVPSKLQNANNIFKISANSLRGDNRFVQMAVCHINEVLALTFKNEYAYDEDIDPVKPYAAMTESVEMMRGYGDDDNNLVQFMQKKHHNIKQGMTKAKNEWELIKKARSPEYPIYLSYTPYDLEEVGGSRVAHPRAVYYITTDKQPVGAMSIEKLKQNLLS